VAGANLSYDVVPAVVPGDAGFAGYNGPRAVTGSESFTGFAVGLERDIKTPAIAFADLPFADEVVASGGAGCGFEFNAGDICGGNVLLASIFEDEEDGSFKFDAGEIRLVDSLAMAVLEYDHDR